jgi:hypothetical protein
MKRLLLIMAGCVYLGFLFWGVYLYAQDPNDEFAQNLFFGSMIFLWCGGILSIFGILVGNSMIAACKRAYFHRRIYTRNRRQRMRAMAKELGFSFRKRGREDSVWSPFQLFGPTSGRSCENFAKGKIDRDKVAIFDFQLFGFNKFGSHTRRTTRHVGPTSTQSYCIIHFRSKSLDLPAFALRWGKSMGRMMAKMPGFNEVYMRNVGMDDVAIELDPRFSAKYQLHVPREEDVEAVRALFSQQVISSLQHLPGFSVEGNVDQLIIYPGSQWIPQLLMPEDIPSLLEKMVTVVEGLKDACRSALEQNVLERSKSWTFDQKQTLDVGGESVTFEFSVCKVHTEGEATGNLDLAVRTDPQLPSDVLLQNLRLKLPEYADSLTVMGSGKIDCGLVMIFGLGDLASELRVDDFIGWQRETAAALVTVDILWEPQGERRLATLPCLRVGDEYDDTPNEMRQP